MLWKVIRGEQMKLRRSPVWLAFFILPVLPAFMGTFNYLQNIEILKDGWYSLWTQHTLFTCYFFLPATIAVYCSYLFRLEHTNHNWNCVMTLPVSALHLYLAKLIMASSMVIMTQLWVGVLFIISGKMSGLSGPVPPELTGWLVYGAIGGIVICGIQLSISLIIRSFAVPVGIAMAGGILGIGALSKGVGAFYPYTLLSLGMRANSPGGSMACSQVQFMAGSLFYLIISALVAILWLSNTDVTTE